jgi:pimeloyl-ACP methyl ester carboxylesterase
VPAAPAALAHQLSGDGDEVVLLLNGGMMSYAAWGPIADGLRAGYRVLGCDLRGQLLSPGAGHPRLADNVPDVIALLDALRLDRVHVCGTSFGAEIGLLLAALHPQRVRTLAAVTAADRSPPGMREDSHQMQALARDILAGAAPDAFHQRLAESVYSEGYRQLHADELAQRRERLAALPAAWYQGLLAILQSIEDFDLTPWLGTIACPTLVVHAAQDAVMTDERVRALFQALPLAELRVHPTSGHVLVVEDPAWLLATYREFLARHPADAPAPAAAGQE